MTAEPAEPGRLRRARLAFRRWRHTRPFLGGLLVTLGGVEILLSERAPLPLVIHIGLQGLAGYLVPLMLLLCGLLLLFNPVQRTFYSLLAVLLSLAAWVTSNLGGFFTGMLLGLVGGALAFAWVQREQRGPAQHRGGQNRAGPGRAGPPRRVRTSGLSLVKGERRADGPQTGQDGADGKPAGGSATSAGPAASGATGAAAWSRPIAPLALSVLAAVAARGLVVAVTPAAASAAGPSPSPSRPLVPAPRPAIPGPPAAGPPAPASAGRPSAPVAADRASMQARFAVLTGLSYDGIAVIPVAGGHESMLKFSMSSLNLPGIVLSVSQGGHAFTTRDSSLRLSGDVELFTTRLTGVLDGIRVTFTAADPPAGLRPDMTLSSVVAEQPFATADSVQAVGSELSTS
ncbi:MAG TPA: DUF6114 domain-containing protein [Streptosporangiaceae bacterium]|nr:DUF6114 domain-containing protein [Streptosporangiaceae bacterium]